MDETGKVCSAQKGVIRTNCVDNLDRTNVVGLCLLSCFECFVSFQVQSLFARKNLLAQFQVRYPRPFTAHFVQKSSANVLNSPYPRFETVFKNMWANHADAVSRLYSGTGALKTDFTRTGLLCAELPALSWCQASVLSKVPFPTVSTR